MKTTRCRDCQADTGRRYAVYCDADRWKHRGKPSTYKLTPERLAYLLEHYRPTERGVSRRIAKVLEVPKWRVCRWAAELGLTGQTNKGPDWTPQQDAFLETHIASRHVNWIAKQLGRSITAVNVRVKRLSISKRDCRDWYTARQVADGFGVDPSTVVRWIERGWLEARHEGQDHPDGRAAAWRISTAAVRRFIQQHPTAVPLGKVEPLWFFDIVFDGQIGSVAA